MMVTSRGNRSMAMPAVGEKMNNAEKQDLTGNQPVTAYRQRLADTSVSREVSATERIQARIALLLSYLSDEVMLPEAQPAFRERITRLTNDLGKPGKHVVMHAHRVLQELEDRIYVPLRMAAAEQFDNLRRMEPEMTGETLLKTLVGAEIDEYQAGNPEASCNETLTALMRASPRADLLINMIRQRNDEYPAVVFSWRPLVLPLTGV